MSEDKSEKGFSATKIRAKAFSAGLVIGGVLGAGYALLNAPMSGKQTRRQIQMKALELQNTAEQTVEEVRGRTQEAGQQINHQIKEQTSAARERVQEVRNNGMERFKSLQQ